MVTQGKRPRSLLLSEKSNYRSKSNYVQIKYSSLDRGILVHGISGRSGPGHKPPRDHML